MTRGGFRVGAGRPASARSTKVVRVSCDVAWMVPHLEDLMEVIEQWSDDAKEASPTSPRWGKAREMLADIQRILGR